MAWIPMRAGHPFDDLDVTPWVQDDPAHWRRAWHRDGQDWPLVLFEIMETESPGSDVQDRATVYVHVKDSAEARLVHGRDVPIEVMALMAQAADEWAQLP